MEVKNPNNLDKIKETKPQKKKAPAPVVRQTITSYKRMLKANPLLELEMKGVNVNEYFNQLATRNHANPPPTACIPEKHTETFKKQPINPLRRTQSLKLPMTSTSGLSKKVTSAKSKSSTINSQPHEAGRSVIHSSKALLNSKPLPKSSMKPKTCTFQLPGTVSHIQPHSVIQNNVTHTDQNCQSTKVPEIAEEHIEDVPPSVSPIDKRKSNSFTFNTPQAYKRRSVAFLTPQSVRKQSLFRSSTPAPVDMKKLQDRLNVWLKTRGKPPVLFKNMRLFGMDEERNQSFKIPIIEENKENDDVNEPPSNSYENLGIQSNENIDGAQGLNQRDRAKYAKEAMGELLTLIEDDYPRNQCLAWLELIKKKYDKADNEPEYWECRAAIEQSVGNIQNAVKFYETAIIQGAEVNSVNNSLDQLLKKFSLLNISQTELEPKDRVSSDRERIVKEARNIFKSTIINFAVGVRNSKKNNAAGKPEAKLFITPVRRSTRISRGGYANTSGLKLCDSLKDFDLNSDEIQFKKNDALI